MEDMSTMTDGIATPPWQVLTSHVFRFTWLTLAMGCGVAVLLAAEAVVLWQLGVNYVPKTGIATAGVWDFAIDANGRWAVSHVVYLRKSRDESLQSEIVLHDLQQPEHPIRFGAVSYPRQLVISARSNRFAIGCYDGSILIGKAQPAPTPLQPLARLADGVACQLACSADGQFIAAADSQWIYLWRSADGQLLRRTPHASGILQSLLFADDMQSLLSVSGAGQVCLWDVPSGQLQQSYELHAAIEQSAWSAGGRWVTVVLAGGEPRRKLLDLETGELRSLELKIARRIDGPLAVSCDGARLATVYYAPTAGYCIEVWDTHSGERLDQFECGGGNLNGLLFAADGTLFAWDSKGSITAWNAAERQQAWNFCALQWARTELHVAGQNKGASAF